ncbi:MAG: sialidase family protein [Bryobacteraceae bacterium]
MLAVNITPVSPEAPAREPQMAVDGSTVALTFGAGRGIYFSTSADSGKTFSAPVKVAEAEIVPLTRHRGPRIAVVGRRIVITAVLGKTPAEGQHAHGLPADGDLIAWRSEDGGKSWSKGVTVNDSPGAPTEGLHALGVDAKGNFFAAWLDHRGGHGTKLYGARSTNGALTWSKNVLVYESPDGTICECCHPSIAFDSGGQILVMFRNWLAGSRDMYLARSRDGARFSNPEKLGIDTWHLNACPMDGGGIATAQNRVVTAWRREHEIFIASPGEREVGVGEGMDVAIAAAREGVYAVWSTPAGVRALLPGKLVPAKQESILLAPKGALPSIVALPGGGALVAWEDDGQIGIQRIP